MEVLAVQALSRHLRQGRHPPILPKNVLPMNKRISAIWLLCIAAMIVGAIAICAARHPLAPLGETGGTEHDQTRVPGTSYMTYEGQQFRLSKEYHDFDDFKDDPNNFLPEESQRMADAVRAVRFIAEAESREVVMRQMFAKQFPGFGCGSLGIQRNQLDDVAAFSVEIPRTRTDRVLGYVRVDNRFILVSDFIAPDEPMLARAILDHETLKFYSWDNTLLHSDPIRRCK
jgi:hypothetical protein